MVSKGLGKPDSSASADPDGLFGVRLDDRLWNVGLGLVVEEFQNVSDFFIVLALEGLRRLSDRL